jgi:hypothetical protein
VVTETAPAKPTKCSLRQTETDPTKLSDYYETQVRAQPTGITCATTNTSTIESKAIRGLSAKLDSQSVCAPRH